MIHLRRLWTKVQQWRRRPGFHSRFGGLWTDRSNASALLDERVRSGAIVRGDEAALRHWIEHGYWIVSGAVEGDLLDRLDRDVQALWTSGQEGLLVEIGGQVVPYHPGLREQHCKLVDLYARNAAGLEVALAKPVGRFLRLLFDGNPLLFQSLSFERGSEQPAHQDSAYVAVVPPLELAAAWIALEDIHPGSGELFYYPGSHRLADYEFAGGFRNWNLERDGLEGQERYHAWLMEQVGARALERRTFCPRKGDVLFWHADLIHGGSPILDRSRTRKSFVCHYCPSSAEPFYRSYIKSPRRAIASESLWSTKHYAASEIEIDPRR